MSERFTDHARQVVLLAREEARMLHHDCIGTEHLLLGLVHEGNGVAAQALGARLLAGLGAELSAARPHVIDLLRRHHRYPGQVPAAAVSWSWAAQPARGKTPEHVVAVQQDVLGQISHDLEDDARFRAEDAGRMARDFLGPGSRC